MFDQIYDSMRKAAELNVQFQQELVKRWVTMWPGTSPLVTPPGAEQAQAALKKWGEAVSEWVKGRNEAQQELFAAGVKQIEQAFRLAEVKDVDTLRARTLELWQKTFGLLQQCHEAQVRDFQAAVGKWAEAMTRAA
jgi:hypothetical protein